MDQPAAAWDETSCIERARQGDEAAFALIYEKYEKQIYAFVYRMMGSPDDAADMTQECFLKAFVALPKTNDYLNLSAWLHRIAGNACLDVLRRRKVIRWLHWDAFSSGSMAQPSFEDEPERAFLRGETKEQVQDILNELSPHYRLCLVLREYQGFSYDRIAEIMGTSTSSVKSMLFRSREQFRKVYGTREGAESR
jgi:RNA polymerase sigma-70 factor, ECF subfamily